MFTKFISYFQNNISLLRNNIRKYEITFRHYEIKQHFTNKRIHKDEILKTNMNSKMYQISLKRFCTLSSIKEYLSLFPAV